MKLLYGREDDLLGDPAHRPLTAAFTVVTSEAGFLLLYNKYRKLWELPGGMIEPGESPRACAVRECMEESGQAIADLRFVALAEMLLKKNAFREKEGVAFGAVYEALLSDVRPFEENGEIERMLWWDGAEDLPGMCSASREMIDAARGVSR